MDQAEGENVAPEKVETEGEKAVEGEASKKTGTERKERRYSQIGERSRCRFCREKIKRVDYKETDTLKALCRGQGRIMSRQRSGNCARHQRMVKLAVKRARYVALLAYSEAPPRSAAGGRPGGGRGSW